MENKPRYTRLEDLPENKSYYTKIKDLYNKCILPVILPVLVVGIPIGAILWGYFSYESSCKRLENSNKQIKLDGIEFQQKMEKIKQDDREMRERIREEELEVLEAYSKGTSMTDFMVQKAVERGLVEIVEK